MSGESFPPLEETCPTCKGDCCVYIDYACYPCATCGELGMVPTEIGKAVLLLLAHDKMAMESRSRQMFDRWDVNDVCPEEIRRGYNFMQGKVL